MSASAFLRQTGVAIRLSACGDAAVGYANRGLRVFPVHAVANGKCTCKQPYCASPGKHPWQKKMEASADPERVCDLFLLRRRGNVGIATGGGIFVLDIDGPAGEESLGDLEMTYEPLPPTLTARTGRANGRHVYFRTDVEVHNSASKIGKGLDIRGEGGYVVAPPSVHMSGRQYEWEDPNAEIADAPEWLVAIIQAVPEPAPTPQHKPSPRQSASRREAYVRAAINAETAKVLSAPEGQRNDTLNEAAFALGQLVGGGEIGEAEIERDLTDAGAAAGLTATEVRKTVRSGIEAGKRDPRHVPEPETPRQPRAAASHEGWADDDMRDLDHVAKLNTDMGNAARLVRRHGKNIRYCHSWGKWVIWNGKRWEPDDTGHIVGLAKDAVLAIFDEAKDAPGPETQKAIAAWAAKSQSSSRLTAMIDLARNEVPVRPGDLDANPMLLNVQNGTVDLRTGELRPPRQDDYLTKICGANYRSDATAPVFRQFLARIFRTHSALVEYVQKVLGYASCGLTSEQALFFAYGQGRNGKTTLFDIVMHVLGDYASKADRELLTAIDGTAHPANIADLQGRRMVICSETNEGRRFDEARLKDLTGETRIKARFLYGQFFEFIATHKLFLYSNHKPLVRGTDMGFWRRMNLIPFVETIAQDEVDGALPDKLLAEADGVLAWLVAGCLAWQRDGLGFPDEVARATDDYRREMDSIGAFLEECCDFDDRLTASSAELYKSYTSWCEEAGEHALSQKRLGMELGKRRLVSDRDGYSGRKIWRGVGIKVVSESC